MKFAADPDVVAEAIAARKRDAEPPAPTRDGGMLEVRLARDMLAIADARERIMRHQFRALCDCDTCRGRLREGEPLPSGAGEVHLAVMRRHPDPALHRRLGRFVIGREVIEDSPDALLTLGGSMIVLDARANVASDTIEYVARSPHFDVIERGDLMPEYEVLFYRARTLLTSRITIRRKH